MNTQPGYRNPPAYFPRPRLLRRVLSALRSGHVFITAPPGYGKSLLLQSVARQSLDAQLITLGPEDADPVLLRGKLAAVAAAPAPLLIDDVHLIAPSAAACAQVAQLLSDRPEGVALAGRQMPLGDEAPGLRLSKAELAFTPADMRSLGIGEAWAARSAGWPLVVSLLAGQPNSGRAALAATDQELIASLVATLLADLPDALHRFVQVTAAPLRCNLALAVHLMGEAAVSLFAAAQQRNVFLDILGDGWFRYHPLVVGEIRAATPDCRQLQRQAMRWCAAQDDDPTAIEMGLDAGFLDEVAQLADRVGNSFLRQTGRIVTFQRWVEALGAERQARYPQLLSCLAFGLAQHDQDAEAQALFAEALRHAAARDPLTQARVRLEAASFEANYMENDDAALQLAMPYLAMTALPVGLQRHARAVVARASILRGEFKRSIHLLQEALSLPEEAQFGPTNNTLRRNLALDCLMLGDFDRTADLLRQCEADAGGSPGAHLWTITMWGWLHEAMGDWDALARDMDRAIAIDQQNERTGLNGASWSRLRALLWIGQGRLDDAEAELAKTADLGGESATLFDAAYRGWIARRRGRPAEALAICDAALATGGSALAERAIVALEAAVAAWEAGITRPPHPEIRALARLRLRPQQLRYHALRALQLPADAEQRRRRHIATVFHMLSLPGYGRLLTHRDPELGRRFYALALTRGFAAQAIPELRILGETALLRPLLRAPRPETRALAAEALAQIGQDSAIPALAEALAQERDAGTRLAIERAVVALEQAPPPSLVVALMGRFAVARGGQPIADEDWQRPAARRLFQYFCLNRAVTLTRDQILDDLWPHSDPDSARDAFKTTYSQVRKTLDPHLRPRAASRYFQVRDETYTFDPAKQVEIDVERFVETVDAARVESDEPPSQALLAALAAYQPVLAPLRYDPWVIAWQERLDALYVQGCQHVALHGLHTAQFGAAIQWAESALRVAPWFEEAHQILMYAFARQEQRSLALRAYAQCVAALEAELGAPPSPLTELLAERLRRGLEI